MFEQIDEGFFNRFARDCLLGDSEALDILRKAIPARELSPTERQKVLDIWKAAIDNIVDGYRVAKGEHRQLLKTERRSSQLQTKL